MATALPLLKRRGDLMLVAFFVFNLVAISYMIDLEQLVIADPSHFSYPIWPPRPVVDAVHWWGRTYDPLQLARPVWWKMTIWIDALFFGPFYAVASYAFIVGREWIRLPSIIYAAVMLTNVTIILGEEAFGAHRTPHLPMVLLANAAWVAFPLAILYRAGGRVPLFSRQAEAPPRGSTAYEQPARRGGESIR